MAQSGGCQQEALGTASDTVADCGLRLTHRTEDLAWPGTQKKRKHVPWTVYAIMCPRLYVPQIVCAPDCMRHRLYVSQTVCAIDYTCPTLYVP